MTITSEKHHCYTTNNSINNGRLTANTNTDEIEVCNILLHLPFLITKSLSSHRFAYNWNNKKPRSALLSPPSPPPRKVAPPPPPPPPVKMSSALETSSPTTPLNFSPSDSDIKQKKRKPQGLNSRKKELEAALQERISTQETLKDSIEKVNLYLDKLKVENSELKAKKQKLLLLNSGDEREKTMTACTPQMQPLIQQITQVNDPVHAGAPTSTHYHHQIPEVNNLLYTAPSTSTACQQQGPSINHHQYPFHYPPPLIPHQQYSFMINSQADQHDPVFTRQRGNYQFDLNIVPEDEIEYKAMAAVARQKRFHVNKEKKARGKR